MHELLYKIITLALGNYTWSILVVRDNSLPLTRSYALVLRMLHICLWLPYAVVFKLDHLAKA